MDFLARLAPPGELVEAERGDWSEQPDAGDDREEEGHQRRAGGHHHRGKADHGVDQPGEDEVAAKVEEIVEPLARAKRRSSSVMLRTGISACAREAPRGMVWVAMTPPSNGAVRRNRRRAPARALAQCAESVRASRAQR